MALRASEDTLHLIRPYLCFRRENMNHLHTVLEVANLERALHPKIVYFEDFLDTPLYR